jgi:hypothetical protein
MTKQQQSGGKQQTGSAPVEGDASRVEGEGSYTGTRRYNEHLKKTLETQNVEELAEKARKALEGDEKAELEEAEERGKRGPLVRPEPSKR